MFLNPMSSDAMLLAYVVIATIVLGVGFLLYFAYLFKLWIVAYEARTEVIQKALETSQVVIGPLEVPEEDESDERAQKILRLATNG